jgi:hypothetical protein
MKANASTDLSSEIDIDMLDVSSVKFTHGQQVDLLDSRYIPWVNPSGPFTVRVEMDEILHLSPATTPKT